MRWCVWSPEFDGGRMVVADDLTEKEAREVAERKNTAAAKHGARGGYEAKEMEA